MKKLIYIAIITGITAGACKSDFLDLKPPSFSQDNLFSDLALSEAFINSLYENTPNDVFNYPLTLNAASDEAKTTFATANANTITQGNYGPETAILNNWDVCYRSIRSANMFLDNGHKLPDGREKNRLMGEAYFMRAYYYHILLKQYGGKGLGLPLIRHAQQLTEEIYVNRSTYDACADSIVSDLDKATALLPLPAVVTAGRPSSGAAMAYKARVLLYAASPMNNSTNDKTKWKRAADAAKALIDANYYSLHDDYTTLFLENNKENIFYKLYSRDGEGGSLLDYNVQPTTTGGRGSAAPTQEAVDAYEVVTENAGVKTAVPFNWSNPAHAAAPYANRDPRFYASVLYNGAEWSDGSGGIHIMDLTDEGADRTTQPENATKTGYYLRKFMDIGYFPRYRSMGDIFTYTPTAEMRYAEVLLNYAEACLQLGQEEEARKYVNLVRARKSVSMPPIPAGQLTWNKYMQERRVELAFEQHRFWDVKRWNLAESTLKQIQGISIKKVNGGLVYAPVKVENRVYTPKMDIFPIPQAEIDKYRSVIPDFKQNPGWE
ncbi:RagB/SusD family nutrient uptake outer membrane protein [Chitinophaga defluvii]|uniref:RagB/SusD family nutrient uptake outer membrane protein n=1 Tax=Chitinophaga defluvii TaxID=3163343 RepID=A0ABV2TFG9_9BACT